MTNGKTVAPGVIICGACVVAREGTDGACVVIYAPRTRNGDAAPYNATGDKPAPSFAYMVVY